MSTVTFAPLETSIHEAFHENNGLLHCNSCTYTTRNKNTLRGHKQSHKEKNVECDLCNKKFTFKYQVKKHMNVHSPTKTYICDSCAKEFRTKIAFEEHRVQVHGDAGKYKCTIDNCQKQFCRKGKYQDHIESHLGLKEYVCTLCKKKYDNKMNLLKHRKRCYSAKKGEKKFSCSCGKKFLIKSDLKQHEEKHSNTFQKCHNCDKIFKFKTGLFRHIKTCKFSCDEINMF